MRKVRVAVIGLGSWGECHLQAFHSLPYVEIAAVCDIREERVHSLADQYGVPGRYTDYEQLCEQEEIDLVSVVTFEKDHLQPTLKALKSGKRVLVEKPVATLVEEAAEMRDASINLNCSIIPGHLLRFDPKYAEVYEGIRSGSIGKPRSIYLRRGRARSLFATYRRTHTVYELMIHDIDLAIWYAASRVRRVRAYEIALTDPECPEILWANLEFDNGVLAVLESHWMTPDEAGIAIADTAEIIGEQGTAHVDTRETGVQIWNSGGRLTPDLAIHRDINGLRFGALREQMNYVCQCIAQGEEPQYTSFADALHGIEVAGAILQSAKSGKEISL